MNKSEILKNMKRIELKRKIKQIEKEKSDLIEANNKYTKEHLEIAEFELRKIAFENSTIKEFVNLSGLLIKYTNNTGRLAGYKHKNKILEIDEEYFIKCKSREGINNKFIETLQHELIHYYCDENLDKFSLYSGADSSPIFHSVITFFNARGLNLKTNGNLNNLYNEYQKELYELSSQDKTTFKKLLNKLIQWQKELKSQASILEPIMYWADDGTENDYEKSKYRDIEISDGVKYKIFQLGMDCNLNNFKKLANLD
ncbi:hypothetical protein EXM65_05895 [Clostridium botulinum]|uniref:SprT-like domain-containing protein n=1 Tax=Clostridium botulinum TaxID=1491 RepID=A0A6M0SMW9_CLOBO|nr:hypothetical protein [Clostridium botulinum]